MTESEERTKLYTAVLSARGSIRLSPQLLLELADVCIARSTMVHTVEAFEITPDSEIARTDLSMYGPDEKWVGRRWNEQVLHSCNEAKAVANQAIASQKDIIFQVWLDEEPELRGHNT